MTSVLNHGDAALACEADGGAMLAMAKTDDDAMDMKDLVSGKLRDCIERAV